MTDLSEERKRGSDLMRKWIIIFGVAFLLFLITMYGLAPRIHTMVRNRTERILQTHFESKVEFSDFEVSLLPRVHVTPRQIPNQKTGFSNPFLRHFSLSRFAVLQFA
jgi:hypothetical protein